MALAKGRSTLRCCKCQLCAWLSRSLEAARLDILMVAQGFCGDRLSVLSGQAIQKGRGSGMLTLCMFDELPLIEANVVKSQLTFKVA